MVLAGEVLGLNGIQEVGSSILLSSTSEIVLPFYLRRSPHLGNVRHIIWWIWSDSSTLAQALCMT